MMTCANLQYIISDLLLNSLVTMGSFVVGCFAAVVSAGAGFAMHGSSGAVWGGLMGFIIGLLAGAASLGVINSGVKTILACWADNSEGLRASHPEFHDELEARLTNNYRKQWSLA